MNKNQRIGLAIQACRYTIGFRTQLADCVVHEAWRVVSTKYKRNKRGGRPEAWVTLYHVVTGEEIKFSIVFGTDDKHLAVVCAHYRQQLITQEVYYWLRNKKFLNTMRTQSYHCITKRAYRKTRKVIEAL